MENYNIAFPNFFTNFHTYQPNWMMPNQIVFTEYPQVHSYAEDLSSSSELTSQNTEAVQSTQLNGLGLEVTKEKFDLNRIVELEDIEPMDNNGNNNLARNLFDDVQGEQYEEGIEENEYSDDSMDIDTPVRTSPLPARNNQPTFSMRRLGLHRQYRVRRRIKFNSKYPERNAVSPVKWWLGERIVYDENGFIIGKDVRR